MYLLVWEMSGKKDEEDGHHVGPDPSESVSIVKEKELIISQRLG